MKPLYMELSESDWQLLRSMGDHAGVSRAEIMRWALRLYAVTGGWTDNEQIRERVVGVTGMVVGPERRSL